MKKVLYTRFFKGYDQSYFLFGPRGTGKSTFLQQHHPNAFWIDFLNPETERMYLARPEMLFDVVDALSDTTCFIIDEVQRVPTVLSPVHALLEKRPHLQFILTGSSSRKLKRLGIDLLGGRALKCHMHPFMAAEIKKAFHLENALREGLVPVIFNAQHKREALQAYISLYLKEEVLQEGLVRNLDNFSRFLEIMSFSHGSVINISNIARECMIKRKTVEGYLSVLIDLLLGYTLPVFDKRADREMSNHPKFYYFDAGVYTALRPRGPLDRPEEIDGVALEGLVAQHLMAWNDYTGAHHQISFWRTRSGLEVDFVVYGDQVFCGIEVKNTARISNQDTKGLEVFQQDYPMAKTLLLYRGQERFMQNGVLCMPCEIFLRELDPSKRLPTYLLDN